MNIPLLSFIIPVYNKRDYLENCIKSVILSDKERNEQIEILLIDDCSNDGSIEICDRWARHYPNVTCVHLDKNVGAGMARNVGLKRARGRYLFFLDADDTIQTEKLPYVLDVLSTERTYPIVCFAKQLRSVGEFDEKSLACMHTTEEILEKTPEVLLTSLWNYIFNLDFLRKESIVFCEERICEDYFVVSKALLLAEECLLVNDMFYNYNKYVADGTAMDSPYMVRYSGGQAYMGLMNEMEDSLVSELKRQIVYRAKKAMNFLMFCIPIPLRHSEETDSLYRKQKVFADAIRLWQEKEKKSLFLCPACDISLEICSILKTHGINIEGFADNNLKNNENVRKIAEKGYLVKAISHLKKEKEFVCVCHRSYLADILSSQLENMEMKKGLDFCCVQEYI